MNKRDLIDAVASETGLSNAAAADTLEALVGAIARYRCHAGRDRPAIEFGSFSTGQRAAWTGRNPTTGAEIPIAAAKTVKFTVGKAFKDFVNVA
ncbi:HU family DNA-binding protein [Burkholderia pyrrocinia]|uniref:HU family DNA-binding protein n=1 Tax=Burkholderia pyrrocinia TaxID=60550 RepID=UPI002CE57D26|nr:HU family DNA-binding protein [Burkholderia sp.]